MSTTWIIMLIIIIRFRNFIEKSWIDSIEPLGTNLVNQLTNWGNKVIKGLRVRIFRSN